MLIKLFIEDDKYSGCYSMTHLLHGPPITFMTVGNFFFLKIVHLTAAFYETETLLHPALVLRPSSVPEQAGRK